MSEPSLPNHMRYIQVRAPGGPECLEIAEAPLPDIREDEILIKVAAAGINRPDIIQRQGFYPPPPNASPILGLEVAGTVAAVGRAVVGWKLEDEVCALTNGGGYAEFVAVSAGQCLPVPSTLSLAEAAAIPETCFTVWSNLFKPGLIKKGTSLLVHGGSSGIGCAAIQLAKAYGAEVITTVGSTAKKAFCSALGADHVINYRDEDFAELVPSLNHGKGVDVILDMVGGDYFDKNLKIAADGGHIVFIAFLKGSKVEANIMPIMLKGLTVTGSTLRPRSNEYKAQLARELLENVWPLFEQSKLRVPIDSEYRFDTVANAHAKMESGHHMGKLILLP